METRPRTATDPARDLPDGGAIAAMPTAPRVVACYSVFDRFFPACGLVDLTDGMYEGDPSRTYEEAQARQAEVLLDRARCVRNSRLIELGCGYGRILRAAGARGAGARGITVSPEQVRRCRRDGLDARLVDYKHLGPAWDGQFDAAIANGSIEHFAQAEDAASGRDDAIYRHLFETARRLLDPASPSGRLVTTAIHFARRPDPGDLLRPPGAFPRGSDAFHYARLARGFGGWYPVPGQLERCSQGLFDLVHEEDGTEDYRRTSEAWLDAVRGRLRSPRRGPRLWLAAVPGAFRHPVHTARLLACVLGSESWNWQFRGDPAPTRLLRQTWRRLE